MKGPAPANKIYYSFKNFQRVLDSWREENYNVVFTNGCFDIIHKGHTDYLFASAREGEKLVVGLNSNESVRELKGNSRPIIDQESRANVLASMFFVDAVVVFEELTPIKIIKKVSPDVLIKGADYNSEDMVGSDHVRSYGGKIKTIPLSGEYSTSKIINKIKSQADEN